MSRLRTLEFLVLDSFSLLFLTKTIFLVDGAIYNTQKISVPIYVDKRWCDQVLKRGNRHLQGHYIRYHQLYFN